MMWMRIESLVTATALSSVLLVASAVASQDEQSDGSGPPTAESPAVIETAPDMPAAFAQSTCMHSSLRRGRAFTAIVPNTEPDRRAGTISDRIRILMTVAPPVDVEYCKLLRIGPILSFSTDGWKAPWWELSAACPNEYLDDLTGHDVARNLLPSNVQESDRTITSLGGNALVLSERHHQLVVVMRAIKGMDLSPGSPGEGVPEQKESDRPESPDLPEVPPHLSTGSSVLDMAVWFVQMDVRQAWFRMHGSLLDANNVVNDMRAMAQTLDCPLLDERIAERLHQNAEGFHSLIWHETWPTDAWELLAAAEAMWRRVDRIKSEFHAICTRVQKAMNLDPRIMQNFEKRLSVVLADLPAGYEWTRRFGDEVEARLRERFMPRVDGGADWGTATLENRDDLIAGEMAGQTCAWKIHGRIWSEDGALLPSELTARTMQHGLIRDAARRMWDESATEQLMVNPGATSLKDILDRIDQEASDPWKPWMVFPNDSGRFPALLDSFTKTMSSLMSQHPEDAKLLLPGTLVSAFGMDGYGAPNSRYTIFPDCLMYRINNHIGLYSVEDSTRQAPE